MYQDLQSSFTKDFNSSSNDSGQSIVGVAATPILSRNVLDMGAPANVKRNSLDQNAQVNIFDASRIPIHIQVTEALVGATGGVQVEVLNSAASNMGTPTVLYSTTIPAADFVVGHVVKLRDLPMGIDQRYVALRFTPLTTNSTAGKIDAFIAAGQDLPSNQY